MARIVRRSIAQGATKRGPREASSRISEPPRWIEPQLRKLQAPTLIVWGTDDVYFPVKWAHWLAETIPGAKPSVELAGARIFFPEERAEAFNQLLRDHLLAT